MRNVDKLVKLCEEIHVRAKEKQLCIQVGVVAEQYIQRCVLTVSNENGLKIPYVHEQTETSILGFYSLHYSVNPCGIDSVARPVTPVKQACTQLAFYVISSSICELLMFSYHNYYYPNFVCVVDSCQRENKARAHAITKASGLKTLVHGTVCKSYKAVALQAIGHHRVREHVLCLLKRDLQK